jgi:hypothetical protein
MKHQLKQVTKVGGRTRTKLYPGLFDGFTVTEKIPDNEEATRSLGIPPGYSMKFELDYVDENNNIVKTEEVMIPEDSIVYVIDAKTRSTIESYPSNRRKGEKKFRVADKR